MRLQVAGFGLLAAAVLSSVSIAKAAVHRDAAVHHDALVHHDAPVHPDALVHRDAPVHPDSAVHRDPPQAKVNAAALYSTHCEMCHGPKGVAPAAEMSFKGRAWKHGTTSAAMTKVIRDGVEATAMIAFKEKLSAAEITALAKLVRSFDPALKPERAGGS